MVIGATPAYAGRTDYGWLFGAETLPERGVELQTWTWEENHFTGDHEKTTEFTWSPYVGVTDQLELGLPVDAIWGVSNDQHPYFTIDAWGVEARYRFVTADPVDRPAFAPLARVAVKRLIGNRDGVRLEADAVGAYDVTPCLQVLADVGYVAVLDRSAPNQTELHPGLGVSGRVVGDLRLGAEVFASIGLEAGGDRWVIAGPNLAWTHGRFWLSAAYGIGISGIRDAPRLQWGILF